MEENNHVNYASPKEQIQSKERFFYNGSPAEYRDLMGADYAPKVKQTALF